MTPQQVRLININAGLMNIQRPGYEYLNHDEACGRGNQTAADTKQTNRPPTFLPNPGQTQQHSS